jgi:surface antigen
MNRQTSKQLLSTTIFGVLSIILAGCASSPYQTNQKAGIQTGALVGGMAAYEMSNDQRDNTMEVIGGTVIGALVGSAIGQAMDHHDQLLAENAITDVPLYQDTTWTNDDTGAIYTVTSVNEFKKGNSYCRKAKVTLRTSNSVKSTDTTMCRRDGKWSAAN